MNTKKLIEAMIENEFHKIQEFKENDDMKNNKEYQDLQDKSFKLFEKLHDGLYKNQINMLHEYDDDVMYTNIELMKYYFKQGIIAAFNELECLKEYSDIINY